MTRLKPDSRCPIVLDGQPASMADINALSACFSRLLWLDFKAFASGLNAFRVLGSQDFCYGHDLDMRLSGVTEFHVQHEWRTDPPTMPLFQLTPFKLSPSVEQVSAPLAYPSGCPASWVVRFFPSDEQSKPHQPPLIWVCKRVWVSTQSVSYWHQDGLPLVGAPRYPWHGADL